MARFELVDVTGRPRVIDTSDVDILAPWLFEAVQKSGADHRYPATLRIWSETNPDGIADWPTGIEHGKQIMDIGRLIDVLTELRDRNAHGRR